jgi:polysaccharide chain length determinant protein (PEP-CTERM system associated)
MDVPQFCSQHSIAFDSSRAGFMVRDSQMTFADMKRILKRWWWILPITTVFFGATGILAAMVLPKRYMSQTMVLVESPTVSSKLVEPVITEDLSRRLSSMQEEILSNSRLQPIIEKFGLYPNLRGRAHMEDLVDRLRSSVKVTPLEPMAGTQNRQIPGFYINVTFNNGQLAQQICTEITSMFLEQNAHDRQMQTKDTTDFIQQSLDDAKKKLDDEDAKLAQFKRNHPGTLPDQEQTNLTLLTNLNSQLDASTQALSRAQQDKTFNQSLLASQESAQKQKTEGVSPETTDQQLSALQDQLLGLQAKYTPEHPDVVRTEHAIEELKKRMDAQQKAATPTTNAVKTAAPEPPQLQQLRAKLRQDDQSIADLSKAQAKIQNDIRVLQGRLQESPIVEEEYKDITRGYQTASDNYNDLLKKHNTSELANHLENQQESEQFKIFDPPSLPSQPSFPNKLLFAGGGLGGGLALGLGILYLIAALDKSLHSERDVELGLKLPLLVSIPALDVVAGQAKRASSLLGKGLNQQPDVH